MLTVRSTGDHGPAERRALRLPLIAIALGLFGSCSRDQNGSSGESGPSDRPIVSLAPERSVPPGLLTLTAAPSPAAEGPFLACSHKYEFERNGKNRRGCFYVPALSIRKNGSCTTRGKFPLLLIAHADGQAGRYTRYDGLARHLASNSILVASMDRTGVAPEVFDTLLIDHLDYIYEDSQVKNFLLDDVALLGHSAGGKSVIRNAGLVHEMTNKQLKAVVLLAPTVDVNLQKTFTGECEALMGMHVVVDLDPNAFGTKEPGEIMQSTFRIYDEAGLIPGQPNVLGLEKDMVFAAGSDISQSPHYFQNADFTKGYVNAFLQLHLRGHGIFRRFFKLQQKVPLINTQVVQQHAERTQLLVADFENGSATEHALQGSITLMGNSIQNVVVGAAHELDDFSCHHTQVMKFDWVPTRGAINRIRFRFTEPLDVLPYRYVTLRITQVYDPTSNSDGTARDFAVRLHSQVGDASVPVSLHGGKLHFPIVKPAPTNSINQEEQTKNAMRTYVIPLRAFNGVDRRAVDEVILDFSEAGNEPTVFLLDNVAFWF